MTPQRRFIAYSVIYWLLFIVMSSALVKFRFINDIRPYIVLYDMMDISSKMPWGLRTLLATVDYWWAYMLLCAVVYIGTCSKLRRYSWRMHLSTGGLMLLLAASWAYTWYWLDFVMPTIK